MQLIINRSDMGKGWELRDRASHTTLGFYRWKIAARFQRWLLYRACRRYNDISEEHLV